MTPPLRIALTGYSRTGKDEIGKVLTAKYGYERYCMGDVIKEKFDPLCRELFGFSAFTEIDSEKDQIRGILERLGYAEPIFTRFFENLPRKCVNTRLFRFKEAVEWKKQGGVIWEVRRLDTFPATFREEHSLEEIRKAGFIDDVILNYGSLDALEWEISTLLGNKNDKTTRTYISL